MDVRIGERGEVWIAEREGDPSKIRTELCIICQILYPFLTHLLSNNLNPSCNSNKKPAMGGESDSYYLQDCNLRAFYIAVYVYVTYIM